MSIIKKTCIVCPIGCHLEAELNEQGEILSVSGNTCRRGETYIRNEVTDPRRTLTSTVRLAGAVHDKFLPVKTDGPISKGRLFEAMEVLSKITVNAPVKRGDVIWENVNGSGVNVIASESLDA